MKKSRIGLGTWMLGESLATWHEELALIREAIHNGVYLIDTAEMYGNGQSELLIGEAIQVFDRSSLHIVSKVLPENATSEASIEAACLASIQRMKCDYIDTYLLHWAVESTDIDMVVKSFEKLKTKGLIKEWGVSNFDVEPMQSLIESEHGIHCSLNQVLFHLGSRGIETELLKWHQDKGIPILAYSPLGHNKEIRSKLSDDTVIKEVCDKYQISLPQLMLAFTLRFKGVIPIPRTRSSKHLLELIDVSNLVIEETDWKRIDDRFPYPSERVPLDEI